MRLVTRLRRRWWAAGLVIVAGLAVALPLVLTGSAAQAGGPPVPRSAIKRLTAIARTAARANEDRRPAQVTAVLTTHALALTSATPGDLVPQGRRDKVYLVTLEGHFTANDATGPPGSAAPKGRWLSLVIDARTFRVTDAGVSPRRPPVAPASLGPVTYLHP
jgi:hypothetical protein